MENSRDKIKRVILTGPESTGKTLLTHDLAVKYNAGRIEEYAREYIGNLNRPYTYEDVLHIALKQVEDMRYHSEKNRLRFADTYLIITKIWFKWVFNECPEWIDAEIIKTGDDLYLLCKPDIPWISDNVRENGGEMREKLFREYENELKRAKLKYAVVEGEGAARLENADRFVKEYIKNRL